MALLTQSFHVNVTDGDPNYSGNFTLATNATADATINGSVYNYTYTADADNAGSEITIIDAEPTSCYVENTVSMNTLGEVRSSSVTVKVVPLGFVTVIVNKHWIQ